MCGLDGMLWVFGEGGRWSSAKLLIDLLPTRLDRLPIELRSNRFSSSNFLRSSLNASASRRNLSCSAWSFLLSASWLFVFWGVVALAGGGGSGGRGSFGFGLTTVL